MKALSELSGGERSVVQTAFLLSVAEKAEGPFRLLDEWNVFMDAANQKRSLEALMAFARANPGKQYILLTPLGVGGAGVQGAPGVKVLRLQAPRG